MGRDIDGGGDGGAASSSSSSPPTVRDRLAKVKSRTLIGASLGCATGLAMSVYSGLPYFLGTVNTALVFSTASMVGYGAEQLADAGYSGIAGADASSKIATHAFGGAVAGKVLSSLQSMRMRGGLLPTLACSVGGALVGKSEESFDAWRKKARAERAKRS